MNAANSTGAVSCRLRLHGASRCRQSSTLTATTLPSPIALLKALLNRAVKGNPARALCESAPAVLDADRAAPRRRRRRRTQRPARVRATVSRNSQQQGVSFIGHDGLGTAGRGSRPAPR